MTVAAKRQQRLAWRKTLLDYHATFRSEGTLDALYGVYNVLHYRRLDAKLAKRIEHTQQVRRLERFYDSELTDRELQEKIERTVRALDQRRRESQQRE